MPASAVIADSLLSIFPHAGPELQAIFAAAWENANLTFSDFCTINDLVDCTGYKDSVPLHVLLLNLFLALEEGSLCIEATEEDMSRQLRGLSEDIPARTLAQQIITECRPQRFPELIGTSVDEGKPVVLKECHDRQFFYFQRYLRHELIFEAALKTRLQANSNSPSADTIKAALADIFVHSPLLSGDKPMSFGEQQRIAIALALLRHFVVISGGPGTGKTSIVVGLLRALVRCGIAPERIALAAPTGRAAQRLTDAVRVGLAGLPENCLVEERQATTLEARTLHSLLRYSPTRGAFLCHAENPVPADVIIVDEVSMVGIALMSQLLQSTAPHTRLILLGDKDQLPSVEAGAVLANLLPETPCAISTDLRQQLGEVLPDVAPRPDVRGIGEHFVLLDQNYRSQTHIREAARALNEQDLEIVDRLPILESGSGGDGLMTAIQQGGCWWLPDHEESGRHLQSVLQSWAERHYLTPDGVAYHELVNRAGTSQSDQGILRQLFHVLGRARVLTVVREGPYGCVDSNRFFDEMVRPACDRSSRGPLFAGAPVLITRNDYTRRLFNGDIGVTVKHPQGGYTVVFQRADGFEFFPAETLPNHELGFAFTVHKSQGSEYDHVLLVLPSGSGRRLLTKEIIYTGITRARQFALIYGSSETLRSAIARRIVRQSGIASSLLSDRAELTPSEST